MKCLTFAVLNIGTDQGPQQENTNQPKTPVMWARLKANESQPESVIIFLS